MRRRSWTKIQLQQAVRQAASIRQTLGLLKLREAGGNYAQIKKYLHIYKIDTKHFKGKAWNKGLRGIGKPRIPLEKILVKSSNYQSYKLKKRLILSKLKPAHCEECGWDRRAVDGRLPLELDHINGNSRDNRLDNLRVLCPNCHSLKPTHRGRNRKLNGPVAE
ncbi:MAG: HNH endonuclease signature motif containing protein [bacterium]|nr:HNH endonuclease signature motif containing protein [bacterium]